MPRARIPSAQPTTDRHNLIEERGTISLHAGICVGEWGHPLPCRDLFSNPLDSSARCQAGGPLSEFSRDEFYGTTGLRNPWHPMALQFAILSSEIRR